jgi:hypothetical protein
MSKRSNMTPEESRAFLRALPDYPFMPCKICTSEGFSSVSCEHIGWERARAWHPGLIDLVSSDLPAVASDTP